MREYLAGNLDPYQILDWDSEFFGMRTAIITPCDLTIQELTDIIWELKTRQIRLVYWASKFKHDTETIKKLSGRLVDLKTTFIIDFKTLDLTKFISNRTVEVFTDSQPTEDLYNLAVQSGEYSRFAVDLNFPKTKFVELYKVWIKKSICKLMAKETLVVRDGNAYVGMVTLDEKNSRGNIGLIAVDSQFRGKKYGKELVRAAQKWFAIHGYKQGQVVTQGLNISACRLYKKCGYSVEKVEYFYHFWL